MAETSTTETKPIPDLEEAIDVALDFFRERIQQLPKEYGTPEVVKALCGAIYAGQIYGKVLQMARKLQAYGDPAYSDEAMALSIGRFDRESIEILDSWVEGPQKEDRETR